MDPFMGHVKELAVSELDFPDWEVLHILQQGYGLWSTILLLRRKESIGEPYAVAKLNSRDSDFAGSTGVEYEAEALAKIPPHSNIIKLYSIYDDVPRPGDVSLILEYCAGEDVGSLVKHAESIQRRIPEVFVWHVLCQALIAMKHLDQNHISHRNGGIGDDLLLRPVEGDAYPGVVLTHFKHCRKQDRWRKRDDFKQLGTWTLYFLLEKADEVVDGTAPYSQELRNFVVVLAGEDNGEDPPPLLAETEHNLIPLAEKQAYGDNKTTHRMPGWMMAYFDELKSKAIPRQSS